MADSSLYQRYNVDGVFNRSVIAGLLYLLNHKITYEQVWQDNVTENVTVPFAYNFSNSKDQRFAQDNYTFFGRECFSDKFIDGKFDMLPRFAVTYTGSQIDSQNITNRFVKAKYQKVKDGEIESYTAFLYSIPMTLNFELEGWIDNYDTAFKIEQKIYETFYKNQTFRVLYKGMSVNCCAGFPESITTGEKTVSYSFEQENQLKMTFNISVEAYYPSFDESTAIPSDKKIEYIGMDISHYTPSVTPLDKMVDVKLEKIGHYPDINDISSVFVSGSEMEIKWKSKSNVSDACTVILYYITQDDGDKHIIDIPMFNGNVYYWKIPEYISRIEQPNIEFIEGIIKIYKKPNISVAPNREGVVGTDCFVINDPGDFSSSGYVQISCEMIDEDGNFEIPDGYVGEIDDDGKLVKVYLYSDIKEKVEFQVMTEEPFKYEIESSSRKITIGISYPLDTKIYDEKHNILII